MHVRLCKDVVDFAVPPDEHDPAAILGVAERVSNSRHLVCQIFAFMNTTYNTWIRTAVDRG